MSLADEVRSLRQRVADRLAELEPLVREYAQLQRVATELGIDTAEPDRIASDPESEPQTSTVAGKPESPPPAPSRRRATRRRRSERRPPGQGEYRTRVLGAVRDNPGATVAELAEIMGIPTNALYRPVRELTNEGQLVKRGRGLFPADVS